MRSTLRFIPVAAIWLVALPACGFGGDAAQPSGAVLSASVHHVDPQALRTQHKAPDSSSALNFSAIGLSNPVSVVFDKYRPQVAAAVKRGVGASKLPPNLRPKLGELLRLTNSISSLCPVPPATRVTQTNSCSFGATEARRSIVIVGDWQALTLLPMVLTAVDLHHWRVILLGQGNCPAANIPPFEVREWNSRCGEHRAYTWRTIRQLHPTIVMVADMSPPETMMNESEEGLKQTLGSLSSSADLVVEVLSTAGGTSGNLQTCLSPDQRLGNCIEEGNRGFQDSVAIVRARAANAAQVKTLDLRDFVCTATECPATLGNIALTYDGSHLTSLAAQALAPYFANILDSWGIDHVVYGAPGELQLQRL